MCSVSVTFDTAYSPVSVMRDLPQRCAVIEQSEFDTVFWSGSAALMFRRLERTRAAVWGGKQSPRGFRRWSSLPGDQTPWLWVDLRGPLAWSAVRAAGAVIALDAK